MRRRLIRWEKVREPVPALGLLFAEGMAGASATLLPVAAQPMTERDEVIFLLHTAAEIEHALLVQYLYAAFSFGDRARRMQATGGDLDPTQLDRVFGLTGWNRTLMRIAIEEMCHLMTVQNVLRVLGGPLNLEREDFPFRADFYPFPFNLEPATKDSLAKYVAAEMPASPDKSRYPRIDEILERAQLAVDTSPINRVGLLYTRILQLIGGLPDSLFRPETSDTHQAAAQPWLSRDEATLPPDKRLRIVTQFGGTAAEAKSKVCAVLSIIAAQGEGPGEDATGSHFDLFYDVYSGFPETNMLYGSVAWHPALPVPFQPTTNGAPSPGGPDSGRITHRLALQWSKLFNTRYRMLLASILHSLSIDRSQPGGPPGPQEWSAAVVDWAFTQMRQLRPISNVLSRLPRRAANPLQGGRPAVAAAPFELPYTLNLPDRQLERWQLHRDLVETSRRIRQTLAADPLTAGDADAMAVLDQLRTDDEAMLQTLQTFDPVTGLPPFSAAGLAPSLRNAAPLVLRWRPTGAPPAIRYDDVWFVEPEVGWAANSNGEIYHTADGGDHWERQLHDPEVYFRCLGFASTQRGWVGTLTPAKRIFETVDGGRSWCLVAGLPAGAPPGICGLHVVDESVIVAAGTNRPEQPVATMRSEDGGRTWTALDMRQWADNLIDVYFTSPARGWVVGGKADEPMPAKPKLKPVVLYTEDGGRTWVDQVASLRSEFPIGEWGWKIHFVDDRIGFISLQNYFAGAILATSDGGMTWERRSINDPQMNQNIEGIGFVDARHGWVGGWGDHPGRMKQFSSETFDGGLTWINANEIGKNINRFRFLGTPSTIGYASGRTIYKYSSDPVPVLPTAASRTQIFDDHEPIEATGAVAVEITVPANAARLTVRLWNWFGDHVRTLIDEPRPPTGHRRLTWDRTDDAGRLLPPDAFIWRITIDDRSESRLVVLM